MRNSRHRPGVHPDDMFDDDPTLASFARDLRAAAADAPPAQPGAVLAAVLAGRAPAPATASLPPTVRRRRNGLRWVIGGAVFGLGVGSLGVAGALPDPVQRQVASFGDAVGIDLPEPASDTPATSVVPTVVPPSTVPPARTAHPSTTVVDDRRGSSGADGEGRGRPTTTTVDRGNSGEHRSDGDPRGADDPGTENRGSSGSENGSGSGGDDSRRGGPNDDGSVGDHGAPSTSVVHGAVDPGDVSRSVRGSDG